MIGSLVACIRSCWRFRGYRPQPVTIGTAWRWLAQFKTETERKAALALLDNVIFIREREVESALVQLNRHLLKRLQDDGVPPDRVIYVQHDDAGSSSPVMLNKLRDGCRLQSLGCPLLDSKNARGINEVTNDIGTGAIVYVDEFAGTGDQFMDSLSIVRQCIVGTFVEFVLVHTICEEALVKLGGEGIEPIAASVHARAQRPLHANSYVLPSEMKQELLDRSKREFGTGGLGHGSIASMVVYYNNAPDNVPRLIRGSKGQTPFRGILPRITDLPNTWS